MLMNWLSRAYLHIYLCRPFASSFLASVFRFLVLVVFPCSQCPCYSKIMNKQSAFVILSLLHLHEAQGAALKDFYSEYRPGHLIRWLAGILTVSQIYRGSSYLLAFHPRLRFLLSHLSFGALLPRSLHLLLFSILFLRFSPRQGVRQNVQRTLLVPLRQLLQARTRTC